MFASSDELHWLLDAEQQELVLRLPPDALGGYRAHRGTALAQAYAFRADSVRMRVYANAARRAGLGMLRDAPNEPGMHGIVGLMAAFLGRRSEAVSHRARAVELVPVARDPSIGPDWVLLLARVYAALGEHDRAVAQLERLLNVPYPVSAAWLRIDPNVASARAHRAAHGAQPLNACGHGRNLRPRNVRLPWRAGSTAWLAGRGKAKTRSGGRLGAGTLDARSASRAASAAPHASVHERIERGDFVTGGA